MSSSKTNDDNRLTWTDRGWPRPIINGWPIPWVSPAEELKRTDPDRMSEVVEWAKCQVCGLSHKPWEIVYFLVNRDITGETPSNLEGKVIQAMDQAVMHERCMKLATGRCPVLCNLRGREALVLYAAYWRDVKIYDVPEEHRAEEDSSQILGVDGKKAWRAAFPEELSATARPIVTSNTKEA